MTACHPIIKTEYIHSIDSVYFHTQDSIYIKEYRSGDTVYLTKDVIKIAYKDRYKCDTINRTDTVVKYINRTVKVPQKRFKLGFWIGILIGPILFIIYKIVKRYVFHN